MKDMVGFVLFVFGFLMCLALLSVFSAKGLSVEVNGHTYTLKVGTNGR